MNHVSILSFTRLALATAVVVFMAGQSPIANAAVMPGTVNLTVTPPDLTTSVDPNIVVTFDDSGSMQSNFMGDDRPFDGGGWGGPWRCAGVIDPRGGSVLRNHAMNGVYYNPNVLYLPPVNADGSVFPNADASLNAVWADGIAVNRPRNNVSPLGAAYNNNPNSSSSGSDNRVTKLNGAKSSSDRRWKCGYGSNPGTNSGGPYYYRLKNTVTVDVNPTTGNPTAAGLATLYNNNSWEAVMVPNTVATIDGVSVNQWQNFANWYAYYRTRNLMTRTALSRVFSNFGTNLRVAWQNINNGDYRLPANSIIANLVDAAGCNASGVDPKTVQTGSASVTPSCYRSALFNWIFETGANGATPDRAATIRGGQFFERGDTSNYRDPYWQPADGATGVPARELSCRQNFHMLVTDGYWNEGDPGLPSPFHDGQTSKVLPDGKGFNATALVSRVFWDVKDTKYTSSLANIAFNYWSRDLRPDLTNNVPAYFKDKTTGITGSTPLLPGQDPADNKEIYFNPANDPATWQHVVQFMVTLGIAGRLTFSEDVDCNDPNNDLCKLRKGQVNSAGGEGWPRPVNNAPEAVDDTWHAAINGRGSYFSAGNPAELVAHLTQIIANVLMRSTTSTAAVTSLPFQTIGNAAFGGSYDSGDWSGRLLRMIPYDASGHRIDPPTVVWDAGCTLTGGNCPDGTKTARTPGSRVILTSDGAHTGLAFQWASLTTAQKALLNANPVKIAASSNPATWTVGPDGFGDKRIDYLRGDRTFENPGSPSDPQFRKRGSVLGAVINSQPIYNASAASGWADVFPPGSPEASVVDTAADYQHFVDNNKSRAATTYVGSNDGMLHAFNAVTGVERWAFVPNTLIENGNLTRMTDKQRGLTPGVDSQPTVQDVFINGAWRTVLVGSLRLGGRGLYALDVTNPAGVTEGNPNATVMWEFSNKSPGGANLGYSYGRPNIVRLNNGKWVVLVSSGYFPNGPVTDAYDDPASADPAASKTSLFVIDLETGTLIKELQTSSAPQFSGVTTYGLSQPGVYDLGGDQVDDVAVAGDLAGNLWRFDLGDPNPNNWKVDLMFKTYPSLADNGSTGKCDAAGKCPITVMPLAMRNPAVRGIVWIFGTGKYLGKDDRSSIIPAQSFYGVYDYGVASSKYPLNPSKLNTQGMVEQITSGKIERFVSPAPIATVTDPAGWKLALDIPTAPGERNVVTGAALDTSNRVVLATLIPTTSDPCSPGRKGAIILLDAATGGGVSTGTGGSTAQPTYVRAGVVDTSGAVPSSGDSLPITTAVGGGVLSVLGVDDLSIPDNYWFRTAWRRLLDTL